MIVLYLAYREFDDCVLVGDSGEVRLLAENGKSGESMEKALVHSAEWRDSVL